MFYFTSHPVLEQVISVANEKTIVIKAMKENIQADDDLNSQLTKELKGQLKQEQEKLSKVRNKVSQYRP